MKVLLPVGLVLLILGCAKKESVEPPAPSATTAPDTQPAAAPPPVPAQATATLPANAPIPANGVLLWLSADDAVASARDGKCWRGRIRSSRAAPPRISPNSFQRSSRTRSMDTRSSASTGRIRC